MRFQTWQWHGGTLPPENSLWTSQSPQYFYKYFTTDCLVKQGLTPSNFEPYLFLSSSLIVIIYVKDILIYGHNENEIDDFIAQMKTEDVALHEEGTAEGYLGVDIQQKWKSNHLHAAWTH